MDINQAARNHNVKRKNRKDLGERLDRLERIAKRKHRQALAEEEVDLSQYVR